MVRALECSHHEGRRFHCVQAAGSLLGVYSCWVAALVEVVGRLGYARRFNLLFLTVSRCH